MWLQAVFDFLQSIWPSIVGAVKLAVAGWVGREIAIGNVAENELERVEKAMRAAAVNSARPVNERLRDAQKRGLYRLRGEKADD